MQGKRERTLGSGSQDRRSSQIAIIEQQLEQFRHIQRQSQFLIRTIVASLAVLAAVSVVDVLRIKEMISGTPEATPLNPVSSIEFAKMIRLESKGVAAATGLLAVVYLLSSFHHIWQIQRKLRMAPAMGKFQDLQKEKGSQLSTVVDENNKTLFKAEEHLKDARSSLGWAVGLLISAVWLYILAVSGDTSSLLAGFIFQSLATLVVTASSVPKWLQWIRHERSIKPLEESIIDIHKSKENTVIVVLRFLIRIVIGLISLLVILAWILGVTARLVT